MRIPESAICDTTRSGCSAPTKASVCTPGMVNEVLSGEMVATEYRRFCACIASTTVREREATPTMPQSSPHAAYRAAAV